MALALKMTYFAIERMAEPVSEVLEQHAARSPQFRAACKRLATWHSRLDYQRQLRRLAQEQKRAETTGLCPEPGRGQWVPADDLEPPPELTEREATQRGAELLGEGFVISVGLALLYHQNRLDHAAEAESARTIEENEARICELESQLAAMRTRLDETVEEVQRQRPPVAETHGDGHAPTRGAGMGAGAGGVLARWRASVFAPRD